MVSAVNKYTPYTLSSNAIKLSYLPLSLDADGLVVENKDNQTALKANQLNFTSSLKGLIANKSRLSLTLNGGEVWVERFASSEAVQSNEATQGGGGVSNRSHLHELLARLDLDVEDVEVHLDQTSKVNVKRIKSSNSNPEQPWTSQKNNIEVDAGWQDARSSLNVRMILASQFANNKSVLDVHIPTLDLRGLASETEQAAPTSQANTADSDKQNLSTQESPIDWSWMKSVYPAAVNLLVGELQYADSRAEKVDLTIGMGEAIQVAGSVNMDWLLGDSARFKDTLNIDMQLTPLSRVTRKEDADISVRLSSSVASIDVKGQANLNGTSGNTFVINGQSTELPVVMNEPSDGFAHWFPLNLVSNINVDAEKAELDLSPLTMGDSDLQGQLSASFKNDQPLTILFDLQSKLIVLTPQNEILNDGVEINASSNDKVSTSVDSESSGNDQARLFSKDAIDWSWLSNIRLEGKFQATEIRNNETVLTNVVVPVVLDDAGLKSDDFSFNIADGKLTGKVAAFVTDNNDANVDVKMQLNDLILESLNLLPKEQLSGGKTQATTALTTTGLSLHDLASNLNGTLKLDVSDGVIGNDTFELIGSDLVLELLRKLNPFMASDPTTDLDCAVVNLNIKNGQVEIDKSIALETTKISIVADGKVDLINEKLDISFTPKARQGVGLNVGSLVKFLKVGGTLDSPKPVVSATGVLKTGVAVGAALSTGGATLLADGLTGMATAGAACDNAERAFE